MFGMFGYARLCKCIRHLREQTQRPNHSSPHANWPGPGRSPYSEWDIACQGRVITWKAYLSPQTQMALLGLHALEFGDAGYEAFWQWERTQPLRERLRIEHFESTYLSYTVPDSPTFCVWLPQEEIRAKVFSSPVPPFGAIEYEYIKGSEFPGCTTDPQEIAWLMFQEEATLLASNRLWSRQHHDVVQFYRTLPYNAVEQQRRGRCVQTHH